jgi:DNA-binding transcriptional LysR family regulator
MNFKRIETFFWVAKLGSFRKAAEQQFTTQPAISSRIAMLEEELGVRLFERDGNSKVLLTLKGQELIRYAERLMNLSNEFVHTANQDAAYSGLLRLGVSETIAHTWLSDFLKVLHQQLPDITVELTVDLSVNLRKQLADSVIDLAFLMGPTGDPSINDLPLWSSRLHWVASPSLMKNDHSYEVSELAEYTIVTYARNTIPYNEISQKLAEAVDRPAQIFTSSSLGVCRRLVVEGVGIAALPIHIVDADIANQSLHIIDAKWHPSKLTFTASHAMIPYKPELAAIIELAKTVADGYSIPSISSIPPIA